MRVCIIDDNETNLMLFEQIVRRLGDDLLISCFADPIQAVARCGEEVPDLVLVDYMMPGMDGHEVLRRLRALPAARRRAGSPWPPTSSGTGEVGMGASLIEGTS